MVRRIGVRVPQKWGTSLSGRTVLVNPITPDPEDLTSSPTVDRTSDLWDDAATPSHLSHCAYVQSMNYFDKITHSLKIWSGSLLMADSCHQQLGACVATHTPFFGMSCAIHVSWPYWSVTLVQGGEGLARAKTVLALAHHVVTFKSPRRTPMSTNRHRRR